MVAYQIVNFKATGSEKRYGDDHYLAFILPADKDAPPRLIPLGPAATIDQAVHDFLREMAQATEQVSQFGEMGAEQSVTQTGQQIYKLVFAPIEKAIRQQQPLLPHKYIKKGQLCRVIAGPLLGTEGIVVQTRQHTRLVLQVEMLGQATSVEIDMDMIELIK